MENANSIQQNPTKKRFIIVICLFIGIFIAYLDRVNVSVLAANDPFLLEMGIKDTPVRIGMMMSVFLAAYGISNVVLSPIGDYLALEIPVLIAIGERDKSVPSASALDVQKSATASGKKNIGVVVYPGADHLLRAGDFSYRAEFLRQAGKGVQEGISP